MSTFYRVDRKCGVCGKSSKHTALSSTNSFGSPDLDLRPPEMKRSTMPLWVEVCPHCGYASSNLEKDGKRHADFIGSEEYKTCEGNPLESGLAQAFYKQALLLKRDGQTDNAYDRFLYAAWACDDVRDEEGALVCRGKAIELFDETMKEDENLLLRHIDLLRRAGRFDKAIALCDETAFDEPIMQSVARYQKALSQKKDAGCHTVAESERTGKN